jgi:hypothetical protein
MEFLRLSIEMDQYRSQPTVGASVLNRIKTAAAASTESVRT